MISLLCVRILLCIEDKHGCNHLAKISDYTFHCLQLEACFVLIVQIPLLVRFMYKGTSTGQQV